MVYENVHCVVLELELVIRVLCCCWGGKNGIEGQTMAAGHERVTCRCCAGPLSIRRGSSHRLVPASLSWRLRLLMRSRQSTCLMNEEGTLRCLRSTPPLCWVAASVLNGLTDRGTTMTAS
jgi:hypothetical protein